MRKHHCYYTYILSNPGRTCFYIGVTNSLIRRLQEHKSNRGKRKTWAGRYYCYELVYYEVHKYILNAIAREKQLKRWSHKKKIELIKNQNPKLQSLNENFRIIG